MNRLLLTHLAIGGTIIAMVVAVIVLAFSAFGAQAQTMAKDLHYLHEIERQGLACKMHFSQAENDQESGRIQQFIFNYKVGRNHCMSAMEILEWFCGEYGHADLVVKYCHDEMDNAKRLRYFIDKLDNLVLAYEQEV